MNACMSGHEGAARLLVEHRADVNAQAIRGDTALWLAIVYQHEAVAGWLRSIGAKTKGE